jgi:hypothetical protein
MSPEDNLNKLLQIEVPGGTSWEEDNRPSRDADLLNGLRVASPCDASWEEMEGDDLVRFCQHCQKSVYNLSGMSRREAAEFVRETEGRLCVRFYRRRDGTLLTDNCAVGFRAALRLLLKCVGSIAATALGLFGVLSPMASVYTGAVARDPGGSCEMGCPPLAPVAPASQARSSPPRIDDARQKTRRRRSRHRHRR